MTSQFALAVLLAATAMAGEPRLAAIPRALSLRNASGADVSVSGGAAIEISAKPGTNLFRSPDGKYNVVNVPMALFAPDRDFVLRARVSAQLRGVYDVAALVLFEDEGKWAKLCFENSARTEATVVSVATRGYSDDANSETVEAPYVYLAIARKGEEISFHFSRDGRQWKLARHFRMEFGESAQLGFAVHTPRKDGFSAEFSEIGYRGQAPRNMRQLEAADLAPAALARQAQTLKLGVSDWLFWHTYSDGVFSGAVIDIWREVARRNNLQIEYTFTPNLQDAAKRLKDGSIDAFIGLLRNPERDEYLWFIEPPFRTKLQYLTYVRAGSNLSIERLTDMHGRTVALASPSSYAAFDDDPEIRKEPARSWDAQAAVDTLLDGRAEALHISQWQAIWFFKNNPQYEDKLRRTGYIYRERVVGQFEISVS
jgi:regulation of enolase protein 1 (concanavalin A-like superfamily)